MNEIESIAAIVGGFAALGALLWAMLGNPSMTAWLRARLEKSSLTQRRTQRRIVEIDWDQVQAAASAFAKSNSTTYDLVVGLQPDGVSLANILAGRLQSRYAAVDKQYPKSRRTPFFVFESDGYSRSVRPSVSHFVVPPDIVNPSRILVVDGVTTFGNALAKAAEVVLMRCADARIDFYVFAIDEPRLAAAHPELVDRITFHISIDNYVTWLHFPWDPL